MKILVLAAHPDDETLGCGATIARLANEGHHIKLITFTDGVSSRTDNTSSNRNHKLDYVTKILGIQEYTFGDFPDNQMDSIPLLNLCKFIEKNTLDIDFVPDLIFTHHPDCLNIDHALVYRATVTVFRPQQGLAQNILSYYVPSSTDYNPLAKSGSHSYYIVNQQNIDLQQKALQIYKDEMRTYPHTRSYENIINLAKVNGSVIGTHYAEKFRVIRMIN